MTGQPKDDQINGGVLSALGATSIAVLEEYAAIG
jgi:hypothetical protein